MNRTNIDIPTVQNVVISYPLASFGERLIAMLIDGTILSFLISMIILALTFLSAIVSPGSSGIVFMLMGLSPVFVGILYFSLFEMLNRGRTPGKAAMQIKVMKSDGNALPWSGVFFRAVCLLPDAVFSMGVVGSVLINTTPKRQRLGDIAAGTVIVKAAGSTQNFWLRDVLSIQTLSEYTPVYPEVRNLTEKDMIFIKSVISRTERYQNSAHHDAVLDLSEHLRKVLEIEKMPSNRLEFLRTILRDYVVLTR